MANSAPHDYGDALREAVRQEAQGSPEAGEPVSLDDAPRDAEVNLHPVWQSSEVSETCSTNWHPSFRGAGEFARRARLRTVFTGAA